MQPNELVEKAIKKLSDKFSKPPHPCMSREEFEKLDELRKCVLTCNYPRCKNVVSTHGLVCVEHYRTKNK